MSRLILILLLLNFALVYAFPDNLSSNDSIVLKAMRDELKRNMDELVYADYNKSFFISYTLADIEEIYVTSSLGALVNSKRDTGRTWAARVMVGDYEVNDENYEDYSNVDENEMDPIELPIEYDYYGLRRTLWTATNYIYKKAALSYKNKMLALKQNNLSDSALQIDDFSKTNVVKIYEPSIYLNIDNSQLENLVRDLSAKYLKYPEIIISNITIDAYNTRIYFINSEGIESVTSEVIFTLKSSAQMLNNDGEILSNHFAYHFTSLSEFPDTNEVIENIELLAQNLTKLKDASTLEENYYGPILFTGQAVAHIFEQNLFLGSNKLVAKREPLVNSPQMSMYYDNPLGSIEDKINKRIASNNLNIRAYSKLKEFNGEKLLGSFKIDAEGVVPPDELVLVEDGILKTLLNDRTPTRKLKLSNGHKRYAVSYGGLAKQTAPGVISISCNDNNSLDELKQKLIEQAKQEGLKYGIMLKPVKFGNTYQSTNVYKVWVEDGHEELVTSAFLKKLPSNSLKRIMGSTSKQFVYNTFAGSNSLLSDQSLSRGLMVTYMVPDAVLFEESEIINVRKAVFSTKPIVKSPVDIINSKNED